MSGISLQNVTTGGIKIDTETCSCVEDVLFLYLFGSIWKTFVRFFMYGKTDWLTATEHTWYVYLNFIPGNIYDIENVLYVLKFEVRMTMSDIFKQFVLLENVGT